MRCIALVLALVVLAGCESTQDKSARLARKGQRAFAQKGLDVRRRNAQVKVEAAWALQDTNGTATVTTLRNSAPAALRGVPVELTVSGRAHKVLFRNNAPGLEASLVGPSLIPAHGRITWVNDQVTANGRPTAVEALPGPEKGRISGDVPRIQISRPNVTGDPVSGVEAVGTVTNRSDVEQRDLVLYAVARRGGKPVAAGRGQVPRLWAGQSRRFHIFFIGDPRGAALSVDAPPTTFK